MTLAELAGPDKQYQAYAAAQLDWERVGASYDSFGDVGLAVDGLPDGCPAASPTRTSPGCTASSTACGTARAPRMLA